MMPPWLAITLVVLVWTGLMLLFYCAYLLGKVAAHVESLRDASERARKALEG